MACSISNASHPVTLPGVCFLARRDLNAMNQRRQSVDVTQHSQVHCSCTLDLGASNKTLSALVKPDLRPSNDCHRTESMSMGNFASFGGAKDANWGGKYWQARVRCCSKMLAACLISHSGRLSMKTSMTTTCLHAITIPCNTIN